MLKYKYNFFYSYQSIVIIDGRNNARLHDLVENCNDHHMPLVPLVIYFSYDDCVIIISFHAALHFLGGPSAVLASFS